MKFGKSLLAILGVLVAAIVAFFGLRKSKETSAMVEQEAQLAKTKTEENLEKTPAPDLVDADPRASELRLAADSIKSESQTRIRDALAKTQPFGLASDPTDVKS